MWEENLNLNLNLNLKVQFLRIRNTKPRNDFLLKQWLFSAMVFYTKPRIIGLPVQPVAPSHRIGPSHPPPTSKRSPSPVQPDPARHSVRPCRAPQQPHKPTTVHRTNTTSPTWQTSKCKTTSITGLPTAPNHNSQGPDVLSALHIHSVPRYSAWLDLAPFPAHSKPISNEFPRSQFKNTRGRLLAPMKFNSTSHSLC